MSNDQFPMTVKLRSPIEFGKDSIESLIFQEGTLGALKGMGIDRTPNVDELIQIAARLCGQPLRVIESLKPGDVQGVIAIALGFFIRCLGVG